MNNSVCECPICMEDVFSGKNCVVTECGHSFHTSCLMTNVAHNGFSCPYCRTEMAEEQADSDDEDGEDDDEDWVAGMPRAYVAGRREDYALRGMRWLFQQADGDNEDADNEDEQDDNPDEVLEADDDEEAANTPKPSLRYLTQKLTQQGVTMEMLVKTLLMEHEEYIDMDEECTRACDELFGKVRIIVSNYDPDDELPKDTPPMTDFIADRFLRVV
jgi:hypothetical protein